MGNGRTGIEGLGEWEWGNGNGRTGIEGLGE